MYTVCILQEWLCVCSVDAPSRTAVLNCSAYGAATSCPEYAWVAGARWLGFNLLRYRHPLYHIYYTHPVCKIHTDLPYTYRDLTGRGVCLMKRARRGRRVLPRPRAWHALLVAALAHCPARQGAVRSGDRHDVSGRFPVRYTLRMHGVSYWERCVYRCAYGGQSAKSGGETSSLMHVHVHVHPSL